MSVKLAIFAAELVIKNFEDKYPNDKRPREAIEAAKKWLELQTTEAASAARSAAWSAESAERSAIYKKLGVFMTKRIKELEEIKE